MLLIPEVPFICEVTNMLCLQSEVPLKFCWPVFDPVLPYETDALTNTEVSVAYA
jgi:hypothetical protein